MMMRADFSSQQVGAGITIIIMVVEAEVYKSSRGSSAHAEDPTQHNDKGESAVVLATRDEEDDDEDDDDEIVV